jgi:anti-sigma factor RsiW
MPCDPNPATLGAYLDGELPAERAGEIREHVTTCPRCSAEVAELARMQRSLRVARERFAPTPEFRRKIQQQIAAPKRRSWSLAWLPAAISVAAMLLIAFVWIGSSHRSDAFAEVADLHVNALASANPVDVVSTDRHTVKPWYSGKIPFSFNLPEFAGTDYTLIGGRLVYFHQQPGAQLIVARHQHRISVLIFQESPQLARSFAGFNNVQRRNSFAVDTWSSQGLRFVLVSDADPAAIDKLSQLFKQANS